MSFRARLTLVAAAAVALAVVVASIVVYFVVRGQLYREVDTSLKVRAADIIDHGFREETGPDGHTRLDVGPPLPGSVTFVQAVKSNGSVLLPFYETGSLPVGKGVLGAARGQGNPSFSDVSVSGRDFRVLTVPGPGVALQLARDLSEVNHTLSRITLFLVIIAAGGVAVAAGLGIAVSGAALVPIRRLRRAAEHVAETGDLSERIADGGNDELSRLASSFNTMLRALEESRRVQRQLVADASHELRTPLTSLRTNLEVLASERTLPPGERERLLSEVVEQLGEMTTLVSEMIELARGEQHPEEAEEVRLDLVVADAVERARRNRPGVTFSAELEESLVRGVPATIERAVGNLLDNAAKWSPPRGEVEVAVRDGTVTVRDHGSGIDEADLPYVFDRFYRAKSARGMSGSGLGLAIVRQVAEAHGGEVVAERAEGGGTLMTLRLCERDAPAKPARPSIQR